MSYSQNLTNILNEDDWGTLRIGCCVDEYLEDFNEDGFINVDDCVYPGVLDYYVTEDIYYTRPEFVLRGGSTITFRNGANFYLQGASISFTCGSGLIFDGGGIFQSVEDAESKVEFCEWVCHNGKVVKALNDTALQGHLGHGDTYLGNCEDFDGDDGDECSLSLSLFDYSKTLKKGEKYIIYNSLGQMIKIGSFKGMEDLYSNEIRLISFPRLNYSSKMIIKR